MDIIFSSADKDLGPISVTLEKYTNGGLRHLQNKQHMQSSPKGNPSQEMLNPEPASYYSGPGSTLEHSLTLQRHFLERDPKKPTRIFFDILLSSTSCIKHLIQQDPFAQIVTLLPMH